MKIKSETVYVRWFADLTQNDIPIVGGKNANLGEMVSALKKEGIRVPDGFALTAEAYWEYVRSNKLEEKILEELARLKKNPKLLESVGKNIRNLLLAGTFPEIIERVILDGYRELCSRYGKKEIDVAVRSSATAEDLPGASFAGQHETYLNIRGEKQLLEACRKCYASLFKDRAISYREQMGFDPMKIALSVGVQKMIRSDKASSGVMFSIDTESGFPRVVEINASWGLGENIVQGSVIPDEYVVFKPVLEKRGLKPILEKKLGAKEKKLIYAKGENSTVNVATSQKEREAFVLSDEEILQLARWACAVEKHYGKPMDMEWAKDGETGELFFVQARPETVQSKGAVHAFKTYRLLEKGKKLLSGLSVGEGIAAAKACRIKNAANIEQFEEGSILVAEKTDPDWVPIMKKAKGIITDTGGRTCHAAIVSRELGIPAVIGTEKGTSILKNGQKITLSCAEGEEGRVYEGVLKFEESAVDLKDMPKTKTRIMMNIANPDIAFQWWYLPCEGIGLARMEFIISSIIKVHPMALVHFDQLKDKKAKKQIEQLTKGFKSNEAYFVNHLARGIAKIAASQYPEPVIVRMSDFKTNEYANLIGGRQFEPQEENPMLGFRGASRYYDDRYREGFALECKAIKMAREEMGLENILIMIPFCRTLEEADKVLAECAKNGLKRGENGLRVYVMCEIPSNVILAEEFAQRFDGFSIGSNDLTQLTLGVDRDSGGLSKLFDERNEAVKRMIRMVIQLAHKAGSKVGICGQAPSDYPDFAAFLVECGIDSISLNPDSVIAAKRRIAQQETENRR